MMREKRAMMQNQAKEKKRRGPGRPEKNQLQGDVALLRAGQAAFARHGFEGASLRQIAASAGVDPALAAHHFGSKEALWRAVIERMSESLAALLPDLHALRTQRQVPIRVRLEEALRQLVSATCEEPELGMFISRLGAEKGEKLDFLIEKLLRPYHDAFRHLLLEAMRAKVIARQPVEVLYLMLLHAIAMTISYRQILDSFGEPMEDLERLKAAMTHCVLATFFGKYT
jgi:AcrR family transcriptional regulator